VWDTQVIISHLLSRREREFTVESSLKDRDIAVSSGKELYATLKEEKTHQKVGR